MLKDAVVIAHNRFRQLDSEGKDWHVLAGILDGLNPRKDYIISVSTDTQFGELLKVIATSRGFAMYELSVNVHNKGPRYLEELLYMSRHASLIELGKEFHVFVGRNRMNTIEDLADRVKQTGKKLVIYGYNGEVLEA